MITTQPQKRYQKYEVAFLQDTFRLDLKNRFEGLLESNLNVDHINQLLCKVVNEAASKHLGVVSKKNNNLSQEILKLIQSRR